MAIIVWARTIINSMIVIISGIKTTNLLKQPSRCHICPKERGPGQLLVALPSARARVIGEPVKGADFISGKSPEALAEVRCSLLYL